MSKQRSRSPAGQSSELLAFVVTTHLWIEHHLQRALSDLLEKPDALFAERPPPFAMLVALCEAHGLLPRHEAALLLQVNALRNKFAHRLGYSPDATDVGTLLAAVRGLEPALGTDLSAEQGLFVGMLFAHGMADGLRQGVKDGKKQGKAEARAWVKRFRALEAAALATLNEQPNQALQPTSRARRSAKATRRARAARG